VQHLNRAAARGDHTESAIDAICSPPVMRGKKEKVRAAPLPLLSSLSLSLSRAYTEQQRAVPPVSSHLLGARKVCAEGLRIKRPPFCLRGSGADFLIGSQRLANSGACLPSEGGGEERGVAAAAAVVVEEKARVGWGGGGASRARFHIVVLKPIGLRVHPSPRTHTHTHTHASTPSLLLLLLLLLPFPACLNLRLHERASIHYKPELLRCVSPIPQRAARRSLQAAAHYRM